MLDSLMLAARQRGVQTTVAYVLAENWRMLRFLRESGYLIVTRRQSDVVRAELATSGRATLERSGEGIADALKRRRDLIRREGPVVARPTAGYALPDRTVPDSSAVPDDGWHNTCISGVHCVFNLGLPALGWLV